jgi:hypothetical protein
MLSVLRPLPKPKNNAAVATVTVLSRRLTRAQRQSYNKNF